MVSRFQDKEEEIMLDDTASMLKEFEAGRHQGKVCLGTACHVTGADIILENSERKLEIQPGETTPDRGFSIGRLACVGCCALAPVAIVDNTVCGHMAPSKAEGVILGFQLEKERVERERDW